MTYKMRQGCGELPGRKIRRVTWLRRIILREMTPLDKVCFAMLAFVSLVIIGQVIRSYCL